MMTHMDPFDWRLSFSESDQRTKSGVSDCIRYAIEAQLEPILSHLWVLEVLQRQTKEV